MKRTISLLLTACLMLSCAKNVEKATAELEEQTQSIMESLQQTTDEAEAEELFTTYLSLVEQYLLNYADSEQGIAILRQTYYLFSTQQLEKIFSKMDHKTLEREEVAPVYAKFKLLKQTEEGTQFTDFSALTPEGENLSLSDLVGQTDYVLVDFWASWCGPCRRSMPTIKEFYEQYQDKLQILGVSLDNDEAQWKEAIQSLGLPWKHISDLQGWQSVPAELYGISAIPATVLINKEGIIIGRNMEVEDIKMILSE